MSFKPSFFSRKGRLTVSRPLAVTMNTLNLLAPVLLFASMILAGSAKFGSFSMEMKQLLLRYAAVAVVVSLAIRVVWGVGIRVIRRRSAASGQN